LQKKELNMSQTATVTYDGKSLFPDKPLNLRPNHRYIITIQEIPSETEAGTAWDVLASLAGSVEAPENWSAEHDHYGQARSSRDN
jgi:hypothetical protein